MAEFGHDMVYTDRGRSARSGGESVIKNLHWLKIGDGGTVGGTAADF